MAAQWSRQGGEYLRKGVLAFPREVAFADRCECGTPWKGSGRDKCSLEDPQWFDEVPGGCGAAQDHPGCASCQGRFDCAVEYRTINCRARIGASIGASSCCGAHDCARDFGDRGCSDAGCTGCGAKAYAHFACCSTWRISFGTDLSPSFFDCRVSSADIPMQQWLRQGPPQPSCKRMRTSDGHWVWVEQVPNDI